MTRLYIIRHGQTQWNKEKRIQGQKNSPLTDEGIQQSQILSKNLLDVPFSKCFSSPMPRAIHTAHLLIGKRNIPLSVDPLLAEMNLGRWEGITATDFQNSSHPSFDAFFNRADLFIPDKEGESFEEVIKRAHKFLKQFENSDTSTQYFLCVTHCIMLQALTMICEKRSLATLRTAHQVKQTTPFIFHYDDKNKDWSILQKNSF